MNAPLDPYRVLGVSRASSRSDIANAFRQLVRQHHPDSRPTGAYAAVSDTALLRIMAAYTILEDPARREQYDRAHPEPGPRPHSHSATFMTWIGRKPADSIRVTPVRWH